jgi:hypothetical protein
MQDAGDDARNEIPGTMSRLVRTYGLFLAAWFAVVVAFAAWIHVAAPSQSGFNSPLQVLHPAYFGVYASTLALLPLVAFVRPIARAYGGWGSAIGRTCWALGLGVTSYGLGNLVWAIYDMHNVPRPYPSWADVGYLGLLPFMLIALVSMARVLDVRGRDLGLVVAAFIGGLVTIAIVVWTVIVVGRESSGEGTVDSFAGLLESGFRALGDLATIVSAVYVITGAVLLAMSFMLAFYARRAASGIFFTPTILIAAACAIQLAADVIFSLRDAGSVFYNGDVSDITYFISMFTVQLAIYRFGLAYHRMYGSALAPAAKSPEAS